MKKNILFVFGTRPEVIKIFPIVRKLREFPERYDVVLCNTGQQKELSEQTLLMFDLVADYNLSVMTENQSLGMTQTLIVEGLEKILNKTNYDIIIVQGDTLSAFCGALMGFYYKIPVFHIEAGLRTNDIREPFPEEAYRHMISCIATLHFAPSSKAKGNLLKENIKAKSIYVCGNTVVDALKSIIGKSSKKCENKLAQKVIDLRPNIVLVTAHRRENQNEKLLQIINAIKSLALNFPSYSFVWPVHPNPNIRKVVYEELSNINNIALISPLDYEELIYLINISSLVMTDSGGIQEEAACLNKSVVIMRNKTERTEILDLPNVKLAGTDELKIYNAAKKFIIGSQLTKRGICGVYGRGNAAVKIEKKIKSFLGIE